MTLIDAFAGTDGTDLASHTPDGGGSWAEHSSYSAGSFALRSNRAQPGSAESLYYHSATIDRTYTISAKVRVISTDQGYGGVAACVTAANTLYVVYLYSPTGQWAIGKYVAGAWTALGTWNDSVSVGTERTVDLVLSSSQVVFKVDGTVRGTFSDTSVTPTRAAVYGGGGSSTQGVHVDDFAAASTVMPSKVVQVRSSVSRAANWIIGKLRGVERPNPRTA